MPIIISPTLHIYIQPFFENSVTVLNLRSTVSKNEVLSLVSVEELRLTFSVRVTLRRLRVENPEEHSVSVGELGHEWVSNRPPTPLWPPL